MKHSEGQGLENTVMYPFYNAQLDLHEYDIERIVAIYGADNGLVQFITQEWKTG